MLNSTCLENGNNLHTHTKEKDITSGITDCEKNIRISIEFMVFHKTFPLH